MRALLVVLGPSLCRLGAAAAGAGLLDQGSLLQKETKLADAPKLADDAHVSSTPAFMRQIPGMEGMMESANISMQDIMGVAQEVLMALTDQEFVDLVNASLASAITICGKWVASDTNRLNKLKTDGEALPAEDEGFELLSAFFKLEKKKALAAADQLFEKFKAVSEGTPKNLTNAINKLTEKMGVENKGVDDMQEKMRKMMAGAFEDVTTCTNVTLCAAVKPAIGNLTTVDNMVNGQVLPMLPQMRTMLPSMGPMVAMMVPEAADTVTDLANYTLENVEPVLTGFGEVIHGEVQTITKISTVHSHCVFGSSGSVRSGPGMLLLAVALAAWASLRA